MHAANRADLNVLPSAVMIYDERERLQAWNDKVALFLSNDRALARRRRFS
ncbi:Signal transduction histidine kinase [Klebsiella pneumoniae]|nr:Signal transduction histidine kinase [Klebsiella pneumoniae]